jgi:hypothetical protein
MTTLTRPSVMDERAEAGSRPQPVTSRSMRRLLVLAVQTAASVALLAPVALAVEDHGQGLYGETDDKVVTNAGFILIAAFPLLILILSLLQWRLEKRKEARKKAEKLRSARTEWRGGW